MKKLLILLALVVALGTSSCVFWFEYEITVENDTNYDLDVALSHSKSSTPSSFTDIRRGRSAEFTVEWGEYYVWVKRDGQPSSFADIIKDNSKDVHSNDTWTITYDSWSGYNIHD